MSKDKPADHDRTNRVFTTLREGPGGRQGLTGAAPVGNRWRAQGFIEGSVRYLGTFDTEQDAHDAYNAAKTAAKATKDEEAAVWMANAPVYVYEGGVGRGARLNGRQFKLVSDELPEHLLVREVSDDGASFGNTVNLNRKYLHRIEVAVEATPTSSDEQPIPQDLAVEVQPDTDVDAFEAALKVMAALGDDSELVGLPPKVAAAIVKAREHLREGTRESREARAARDNLKHEIVDAAFGTRSRSYGDKDRVLKWMLSKVRHSNMDYSPAVVALRMVQGTVSHEKAINFLKEHTDIDHVVLDEVLDETVGKLFDPGIDPELVTRLQSGKGL